MDTLAKTIKIFAKSHKLWLHQYTNVDVIQPFEYVKFSMTTQEEKTLELGK